MNEWNSKQKNSNDTEKKKKNTWNNDYNNVQSEKELKKNERMKFRRERKKNRI